MCIQTLVLSHSIPHFIATHLRNSALNFSLLFLGFPSDDFDVLLLPDEAATALERVHLPSMDDGDLAFFIEVSCNGIFCVNFSFSCCISKSALWNPATRQFREIPTPKINYCSPGKYLTKAVFGLGFDTEIEDYTLVRIVYFVDDDGDDGVEVRDIKVEVYRGSTGNWREIEDCVLPCGHYLDSVSAKNCFEESLTVGIVSGIAHCVC